MEELETNEAGGKQSRIGERYDLIPLRSIQRMARVLAEGVAKYGKIVDGRLVDDNWPKIAIEDHINHALAHLFNYLRDDTSEDHLGHALCRVAFALDLHIKKGERT